MKWTNVLVFIWQVTCSSMCSNHLSICVLTLVITCFLPYNATRNGVTAIRLSRRHVEFVATTTSLPGVYNIVTSLLHRRDNVSNNFISDDTQSSNNGLTAGSFVFSGKQVDVKANKQQFHNGINGEKRNSRMYLINSPGKADDTLSADKMTWSKESKRKYIIRRHEKRQVTSDTWIEPPFNVTIVLTSWYPPAVRVSWNVSADSLPERHHYFTSSSSSVIAANQTTQVLPNGKVKIGSFRVVYNIVNSGSRQNELEVPSSTTNWTIDRLFASREYYVQVESWSLDHKLFNTSSRILFTSPSNDSSNSYPYYMAASLPLPPSPNSGGLNNVSGVYLTSNSPYYQVPLYPPPPPPRGGKYRPSRMKSIYYHPSYHSDGDIELPFIKLDEAIIVIFVLCFWMGVIALFCNKWGKIRHLEPYHPDYHKRESTDTEIVDPFSSFSERPHVPATVANAPSSSVTAVPVGSASKVNSRMNTLNNNLINSTSISNFASVDLPVSNNGVHSITGDNVSTALTRQVVGRSLPLDDCAGHSTGQSTLRPLNASLRVASRSLNEVSNLGKKCDQFVSCDYQDECECAHEKQQYNNKLTSHVTVDNDTSSSSHTFHNIYSHDNHSTQSRKRKLSILTNDRLNKHKFMRKHYNHVHLTCAASTFLYHQPQSDANDLFHSQSGSDSVDCACYSVNHSTCCESSLTNSLMQSVSINTTNTGASFACVCGGTTGDGGGENTLSLGGAGYPITSLGLKGTSIVTACRSSGAGPTRSSHTTGYILQRSGSSINKSIGYHTSSDRGSSDHRTTYTGTNIMGSAAAHSYYHQIQKQYQLAHQARQAAIASANSSCNSPSVSPFNMVTLTSNSPSSHHSYHSAHYNHPSHHSPHHSHYLSHHRNSYVNYATCPSSASVSAYSSHRPSFSLSYGAHTPSRRRSSLVPSPSTFDRQIVSLVNAAAGRLNDEFNSSEEQVTSKTITTDTMVNSKDDPVDSPASSHKGDQETCTHHNHSYEFSHSSCQDNLQVIPMKSSEEKKSNGEMNKSHSFVFTADPQLNLIDHHKHGEEKCATNQDPVSFRNCVWSLDHPIANGHSSTLNACNSSYDSLNGLSKPNDANSVSILTSSCPITGDEYSCQEKDALSPCKYSPNPSKLDGLRDNNYQLLASSTSNNRLNPPIIDHGDSLSCCSYDESAVNNIALNAKSARHSSLSPFPVHFKLSPDRKIKSAEDLKTLVLDLTKASRIAKQIAGRGIQLESLVPPDCDDEDEDLIATTCT